MNDLEHAVLAFEDDHRRHTPVKSAEIRRQLGITPARFYQLRNRLARDPEAVAEFPWLPRLVEATTVQGLRGLLYARL